VNEQELPGEDEPWAIFERSLPGWFRVTLRGGTDAELYVGAVLSEEGAPVISGLALTGSRLGQGDLRELPLGRIQATLKSVPALHEWVALAPRSIDPLRMLQDEADEGSRTELYRSRGPLRRRLTRPGPRSNEDFYTEVVLDRPALARRGQRSVPVTAVDSWKHHRLKQLRGHAGSPFLDLLVRPGESAARPSPRLASPLEKRLPSMIIFC